MSVYQSRPLISETQVKRRLYRRLIIVHGVLVFCLVVIVARLIDLQFIKHGDYKLEASGQQVGSVSLTAQRGEILSKNSKTGELNVLATNSTLSMVYVDPFLVDDPEFIAEKLTEILITEDVYTNCRNGSDMCPRELRGYFAPLYAASEQIDYVDRSSGAVLQALTYKDDVPLSLYESPAYNDVRTDFQRSLTERIGEKRVVHVPLLYGATKQQMSTVEALGIPGIQVHTEVRYISANPELVNQSKLQETAQMLSGPLDIDIASLVRLLTQKERRYVQIMRRLQPTTSKRILELKQESYRDTLTRKQFAVSQGQSSLTISDPLRSVVLRNESWRYYPDSSIASHVIGFVNNNGEALYGIERSFHPQLRGHQGTITTVSDELGRDIVTTDQVISDAVDGDSIVLTIDRFVQKNVEEIMERAVEFYEAESAQAIVMDPHTGRILAMVNAPVFDSNFYANATRKELIYLNNNKLSEVVVEFYHPETNQFVLKDYAQSFFSASGRQLIQNDQTIEQLDEIETLYDLRSIARYYMYTGLTNRFEIFPTDDPNLWQKYKNNIGVGAYKNRTIQDIYEPGSVMKAITMAIALDEGELLPSSTYEDTGMVEVDEYEITNAFEAVYGLVNMTNCLEQSINTCLTHVSELLGRRLFHRMILRFGFAQATGIELTDEQNGRILSWRQWSDTHLATFAYGQGISVTPLQMVSAFSALANGGKLMKPHIVDSVVHSNGKIERSIPQIIDQVITPKTAETITAMLVSTVNNGPAQSAKVKGYRVAGKTGTSQIPGPSGKYETGTGSTITSFAGYAPINKPKFVTLVKIDRPKTEEFGSKSAAPVFKEIAAFLLDYYGIPPDEQ